VNDFTIVCHHFIVSSFGWRCLIGRSDRDGYKRVARLAAIQTRKALTAPPELQYLFRAKAGNRHLDGSTAGQGDASSPTGRGNLARHRNGCSYVLAALRVGRLRALRLGVLDAPRARPYLITMARISVSLPRLCRCISFVVISTSKVDIYVIARPTHLNMMVSFKRRQLSKHVSIFRVASYRPRTSKSKPIRFWQWGRYAEIVACQCYTIHLRNATFAVQHGKYFCRTFVSDKRVGLTHLAQNAFDDLFLLSNAEMIDKIVRQSGIASSFGLIPSDEKTEHSHFVLR
jgi:hypothetical protein